MLKKITIPTHKKEELVDITSRIQQVVCEGNVRDGFCVVYTPHTTAAITINENADPDVVRDMFSGLSRMVPEAGYHHAEGNSPAHIKSSMFGCSEQIIIDGAKLVLGMWQGIYFCEFDGPRTRSIYVKILPHN